MYPGFSERTFEFCYNSEYCRLNAGLLATHPHIPSQQAEKDLGYDVEFKIKSGKLTKSLFLQHKVASFAEVRAGRNAHFYAVHNAPYFRFPVDNDQHNVLCRLSQTKGNAFYCAPRFHLRHELESHFFGSTIGLNALWLDPMQVGQITDNERHNITYDENGGNPTLHSEARPFTNSFGAGKDNAPTLREQLVTLEYVEELQSELVKYTKESKFRAALTTDFDSLKTIEQVQFLLGRVYQLTWLLLP